MSDKNLNKEVAVEATDETKKASKKTEAVVEPVAQDAPVVEEASVEIANEEAVGFVAPGGTSAGTTYNIYAPWDIAQNGDLLSYNTTVNTKDWAGAIVFQLGQYNTAQRGF